MTQAQEKQWRKEKRVLLGLFAILVFVSGLYVYFVNQTVFHVVTRKALEEDVVAMGSHVALLEREYATLRNTITLEAATERGFRELARVSYVERSSFALNIAENTTP